MLVNFLWIHAANCILGQLFAVSWVELAHLRSLADSEPFFFEVISGFNRSLSSRGPDSQWLQWRI